MFDQFKYQKKISNDISNGLPFDISSIVLPDVIPDVIHDASDSLPILKQEQNTSYIYLIREREHLLNNKPIYKFGRSTQLPDNMIYRLRKYKKGSEIIMVLQCNNVIETENKIRTLFKQKFIQHSDGHEHYYGDVNLMKKIIWDIVNT